MTTRSLAVLVAVVVSGLPLSLRAADGPYRQMKEIAIGGEGGWDYLSVDVAARRLYVSHATKVVVVDIDKDAVVGEIAPAPGVHGIAVAADLGRGFVSNGREATASIVDLKTLQIVGTVKTGENPDAILYEPVHKEVYAFNGRGKSATVFDAKTGDVRATIPLPGKPEFAVFDEKAGRIYNNIEDTNQLVAIDSGDARGRRDLADRAGRGGFGAGPRSCDPPAVRRVQQQPDADGGRHDGQGARQRADRRRAWTRTPSIPAPGLAFASSSDGTLTVARPEGKDKLTVVQTLSTPKRSRTMTLDPKTHRLYVAAAEFGAPTTGAGRQAAASPGRRGLVQGRRVRDGRPSRPLSTITPHRRRLRPE